MMRKMMVKDPKTGHWREEYVDQGKGSAKPKLGASTGSNAARRGSVTRSVKLA